MADIRPFRGVRPKPEHAEKIASPPYDVLSSEEARELGKDNPMSFLHVVKPEIDLPPDSDLYATEVYDTGAKNLQRLIGAGYMCQDSDPCFYLYRQIMGDHSQVGIVACASVDEYDRNIIKKHELTRKSKEDDRTRHVNAIGANTGPVFLTYKHSEKIDAIVEKITKMRPDVDFTSDDGVRHTLWIVREVENIDGIRTGFDEIPELYVADGHHRSASASRVQKLKKDLNPNHTGEEEYNFFLTVIFPDNQMMILDYNRVLKDLNGNSPRDFMAKIMGDFSVEEIGEKQFKPQAKHEFGMFLEGKWYQITPKPGIFDENDPVASLDVSILQNSLLGPILGIQDPRTDERIDFVGGIRGLGELEKRVNQGWKAGFALFPTSIDDLMKIADTGKTMPPKSTWFEPKLRSGMVVHLLD